MAEAVVLSLQEAADTLGICKRTIWRWVHQRKIESVRVGNNIKIRVTEVQRYLDDNTMPRKKQ
jgi:excisionase family DNA binding protein